MHKYGFRINSLLIFENNKPIGYTCITKNEQNHIWKLFILIRFYDFIENNSIHKHFIDLN